MIILQNLQNKNIWTSFKEIGGKLKFKVYMLLKQYTMYVYEI